MPERCEIPGCLSHAERLVIRDGHAMKFCLKHSRTHRCLKCGKSFLPTAHFNRICDSCHRQNDTLSRAEPQSLDFRKQG